MLKIEGQCYTNITIFCEVSINYYHKVVLCVYSETAREPYAMLQCYLTNQHIILFHSVRNAFNEKYGKTPDFININLININLEHTVL